MLTEVDDAEMLDRLSRGFLARGWDDPDDAAGNIVTAIRNSGEKTLAAVDAAITIPPDFLERNGVDLSQAMRFLQQVVGNLRLAPAYGRSTIIFPEEIDSFANVAIVSAKDVADIPQPLDISEQDVKRLLLDILGEKHPEHDWGGESSDAFTTNVKLNGQRTATSFVLKGRSEKGLLTPRRYGKNGDQITRAFRQRASLVVVQANARLDSSMRDLLNGLVHNARDEGDSRAVATLWDGTDTARILAAYGKISPSTGALL